MISYEQRKFWQRPWVIASAVIVLLIVGILWPKSDDAPTPTDAADASSAQGLAAASGPARQPFADVQLGAPLPRDGSRPPDFTQEEWDLLRSATANEAQSQAELTRLVNYLRFQKGFAKWQALQNSPDTASRQRLAEQLLGQLPDRVRNGEMGGGEATLLQRALVADIEPDEAAREQRLMAAQSELAKAAPSPDREQQAREEARRQEYKRREAAIVADYQAIPEEQRNPAQLEASLEEARKAVYAKKN